MLIQPNHLIHASKPRMFLPCRRGVSVLTIRTLDIENIRERAEQPPYVPWPISLLALMHACWYFSSQQKPPCLTQHTTCVVRCSKTLKNFCFNPPHLGYFECSNSGSCGSVQGSQERTDFSLRARLLQTCVEEPGWSQV